MASASFFIEGDDVIVLDGDDVIVVEEDDVIAVEGGDVTAIVPGGEVEEEAAVMATLGGANERLRSLEEVEREIANVLQHAGCALQELSKDKPNERQLEKLTAQFQQSLQRVEGELTGHIRYLAQVATGQPHEGSSYGARKDALTALHRVEHVRIKLQELAGQCEAALGPAGFPM
ncbi:unnamed protein product [Lampetra fluviatilis]